MLSLLHPSTTLCAGISTNQVGWYGGVCVLKCHDWPFNDLCCAVWCMASEPQTDRPTDRCHYRHRCSTAARCRTLPYFPQLLLYNESYGVDCDDMASGCFEKRFLEPLRKAVNVHQQNTMVLSAFGYGNQTALIKCGLPPPPPRPPACPPDSAEPTLPAAAAAAAAAAVMWLWTRWSTSRRAGRSCGAWAAGTIASLWRFWCLAG